MLPPEGTLFKSVKVMFMMTFVSPIKLLLEFIETLVITPAVNPDRIVDEYWATVFPLESVKSVSTGEIEHVEGGLTKSPTLTEKVEVFVPLTDNFRET